jgi:hypothetical protein
LGEVRSLGERSAPGGTGLARAGGNPAGMGPESV